MKKKNSGGPDKEQKNEKLPVKKKMTPQGKGDKSSLKSLSRYSYDELADMDEELDGLYDDDNTPISDFDDFNSDEDE